MHRRGFTLLELMIAGLMATIVLGGVTVSLAQLGLSKSISRQRLDAYSRCDTALRTIRKDIISVLRRDDLFDTRVHIIDDTSRYEGKDVHRDELLIFIHSLRANKEIDFNGEGVEYETQYRIDDDEFGTVLWKRRDPILDDNPIGGGIATPLAEGIVSVQFEAYDGTAWVPHWDSDELGIPHAIRVTIEATGTVENDDNNPPFVVLRTVVPLDRVMPPADLFEIVEEENDDAQTSGDGTLDLDGDTDAASGGASGSSGTGGSNDRPGGDTGSGKGDTFIFTDPDGNVHEIPNP
ncbi:MAG: prepilin-type N-terminal cleavage/methylation domain-containing protein [Phycisphaerales bacterium]|jgi:type II secretion system protein J|nr:prepilin-type N-terminal cleavage/methylation domain-containing protein [Phycisphaerales bacterium]